MNDESGWRISPGLCIPWDELEFRATRAGGPGGQHVNTSATRIELLLEPRGQQGCSTPRSASRLRDKLATRLSAEGMLRVVAASRRSQWQNREEALERLRELVARALVDSQAPGQDPADQGFEGSPAVRKEDRAGIKRLRGRIRDEE